MAGRAGTREDIGFRSASGSRRPCRGARYFYGLSGGVVANAPRPDLYTHFLSSRERQKSFLYPGGVMDFSRWQADAVGAPTGTRSQKNRHAGGMAGRADATGTIVFRSACGPGAPVGGPLMFTAFPVGSSLRSSPPAKIRYPCRGRENRSEILLGGKCV